MNALGVFCAVVIVALALFSGVRIAVSGKSTHDPWQHVRVYRDPETGCEYVAGTAAASALTPRLGVDGRPMCGGEGEQ